jgi:hypothetical protein
LLATFGLALAACSVLGTNEQAFTPALVRQVGTGSVAEARLVPTIKLLKTTGGFGPSSQRTMLYLINGQLDKLSGDDLAKLAAENRAAATHTGLVLPKFDRLATSLVGATVDPKSFQDLPSGSRTFIADWDQFLTSSAVALRKVRQALGGITPLYGDVQSLLRAAYKTAQPHSTTQFDRLRRAVLKDLVPRYQRLLSATHYIGAQKSVEDRLVNLVNGNQDAQELVTKVNQDYPNGFLAQEFKRS